MKKNFIYGFIILVLLLIIGGEVYYAFKLNNSGTNDTSVNEKISIPYLYHILFMDRSDYYTTELYDILITNDWHVKIFKEEVTSENQNKHKDIEDISYNEGLKLNDKHIEIIKDNLTRINYSEEMDSLYELSLGESMIVDYNIQKGAINKGIGENARYVIMALAYNDSKYFDYLERDNDITNYILDSDYRELSLSSPIVEELYEDVKVSDDVAEYADFYDSESFTNDSIITLTLSKGVQYEEKEYYDSFMECSDIYYIYSNLDFDEKAKKLWGSNIKYNIEEYNGTGNCDIFYYDKDEKALVKKFGTGCGLEEEVTTKLEFAYETDKKLVLIEGTLFVSYLGREGKIYNNIKDKLVIYNMQNDGEESNYMYGLSENDIADFKQFVIYYSYTFDKSDDGNYYLKAFSRLN